MTADTVGSPETSQSQTDELRWQKRRELRQKFVAEVEDLCRKDPGARRILRKGLRRGIDEVPSMHELLTSKLPSRGHDATADQQAHYVVAAMIADQPRHAFAELDPDPEPDEVPSADGSASPDRSATPHAPETMSVPAPRQEMAKASGFGPSLGTAFAQAVTGAPGIKRREMRESAAKTSLNRLTRQSGDGLRRHLPSSVRYLRQLDIPVDFAQLLDDLLAWPVHSGRIARRWLQDFYRLRDQAVIADAGKADEKEVQAGEIPSPNA